MSSVETSKLPEGYVLSSVERSINAENIERQRCFVCGGLASTGDGEHVVPKWLLKKFELYDERLTLLNGSFIQYRNLRAPCCVACNGGFLSRIENDVRSIFDKGTVEDDEDRLVLGRWMAKILVGILVKETALQLDKKDASRGRIVSAEFLSDFFNCQLILQSAKKSTRFVGLHSRYPFTLYWYGIESSEREFDLSTDVFGQSLAVRAGRLGVVFVNDGGLQMEAGCGGPLNLEGATVTPLQFAELAARVHTKASLRDASHSYLHSETPDALVVEQYQVRPFTSTLLDGGEMQVFRPWNPQMFAERASRLARVDAATFLDPDTGLEMTILTNLLQSRGEHVT